MEVQLNFENNFSVFLNHLESYFGNGSNFAEPSVGFGNDCDLETWTTMGNTAESDQRLRTTLGTIDSYSIETYNGCAGDPYQIGFNGNIYNEANPIGTEILQNQAGCDSLVHVNLNFVNEATNSNFSYEGCIDEGFSIIINEVVYNQENPSGEEIFTRNGLCDSIVKVDLIFMDCSDPDDGCDIYIPNIISPNDDGFNDQFMIFPNSTNFEVLKILIFDRYGNLLFKSNNTSVILWDATFNNDKWLQVSTLTSLNQDALIKVKKNMLEI